MDELTASSQLSPDHSQSTEDPAARALELFLASDEYPLSHYLSQHGVTLAAFFTLPSDAPKFEKAKQVFCVATVMLSKLKKLGVLVFVDSFTEPATTKIWLAFITAKATAFPESAASEIVLSFQLLLCSMYSVLSQTSSEVVKEPFRQFAVTTTSTNTAFATDQLATTNRKAFAARIEADYDEFESVFSQFWVPFYSRLSAISTPDEQTIWLEKEYEGSFHRRVGIDERQLDTELSTETQLPQPSTPPRNELALSLLHVDSFSTPVV